MTSTASDKILKTNDIIGKIFHRNLFKNNIAQNKVFIIVIAIIFFIGGPFISFIYHSNTNFNPENNYEFARAVIVIYKVISIFVSLLIAIVMTKQNHNKISAIFYNSIPIKKNILYNTNYITGIFFWLVTMLPLYLFTMLTLLAPGVFDKMIFELINLLFVFLICYTMIYFAATVSANTTNTVLISGFICFIIFGFIIALSAYTEQFFIHTDASGLMSIEMILKTNPILYYLNLFIVGEYNSIFNISIIDYILSMFVIVVFHIGGLFLNRINPTENSGKGFFLSVPQRIFKYTLIFLSILTGGIILFSTYQSYLYLILGFILGGFVSFMIINYFIYKNVREIFKGIKNLLIFSIISGIIIIIATFDPFKFDKILPALNNIKSVELERFSSYFNYYEMENGISNSGIKKITDPEIIKNITEALKVSYNAENNVKQFGFNSAVNENEENFLQNYIGYRMTINTKIGFDYYKIVHSYVKFKDEADKNKLNELCTTLKNNENFKKILFYPLYDENKLGNYTNYLKDRYADVYINNRENYYKESENLTFTASEFTKLVESFKSDIERLDIAFLNQNTDIQINVSFSKPISSENFNYSYNNNYNLIFNINKNFTETIGYIENNFNIELY